MFGQFHIMMQLSTCIAKRVKFITRIKVSFEAVSKMCSHKVRTLVHCIGIDGFVVMALKSRYKSDVVCNKCKNF